MREKFVLIAILTFQPGCQKSERDNQEPSDIRAHTEFKRGIPHATGLQRAERLCQHCHGIGLTGGQQFIPSCYSCHGKNWLDDDSELSLAPANHTSLHGKFYHHPDYATPDQVCSECHGNDFSGQGDTGAPSCLLCHEKNWN